MRSYFPGGIIRGGRFFRIGTGATGTQPAPVFTTQPSVAPSSGTAGLTLFTATDGVASNTLSYSRRWLLNGVEMSTAASYTPSIAGSLVLEVRATGPGGFALATTAAVSIAAAPSSDTTAPTITSSANISLSENTVLNHTLTANESVTWAKIGGADQALFTVAGSSLTMSARDYEDPDDADGNNTYVVQVRAIDGSGNFTDQTITVTVTNVSEGVGFPSTVNTSLPNFRIELVDAATVYPPQFNLYDLSGLLSGDVLWIVRSDDAAGLTNVTYYSHTLTDADLDGTPPLNLDFGLSAIATGDYFYAPATQRGSERSSIGTKVSHGTNTVAPTITSTNTASGQQFVTGSKSLTANQTVTWSVYGGADQANFSVVGSSLNWSSFATSGAKAVTVRATNAFSQTADQDITLTVAANTAAAFSFTDATGVALSSTQTSNTITVSGVTTAPVPVSITGGTYSKNGGGYVSTAGTASNGDTFAVRVTASASYSTGVSATLTIGSTSDTYTATTLADPVLPAGFATTTGTNKHGMVSVSGTNNNVLTTVFSEGNQGARAIPASASGDDIEYSVTVTGITTLDPLYIGVDNGAVNLSTYSGNPGGDAKCAVLNPFKDGGVTGTQILGDGYSIFQTSPANQPSGGLQNGDIITVRVKKSTGVVRFFHTRSGSEVQVGANATLSGMSAWYARIAAAQATTFTADFTLWGVP